MRTLCIPVLFLATIANVSFAQSAPKPRIEVALDRRNPLHLRVTITSGAATTVKINRFDLPWGYRYSMVFVAARPDGEALELRLPVDDPGIREISVKAGETLAGDIDLQRVMDLNVLKKSDVLLFCATSGLARRLSGHPAAKVE